MMKWRWHCGEQPNGILYALSLLQPSEDESNKTQEEVKQRLSYDLHPFVSYALLAMELVIVLGVGMLLTWSAEIVRQMTLGVLRLLMGTEASFAMTVAARIADTAVFAHGLLSFLSAFLRLPKRAVVSRVGVFRLSRPSLWSVTASVVFHSAALCTLLSLHDKHDREHSLNWKNVEHWIISTVVVPLKEELFFRLVLFIVVANRLAPNRSLMDCALLTSLLFSIVHLANLRQEVAIKPLQVVVQCLTSVTFGTFLSAQWIKHNSLSECVILHMINNGTAFLLAPMDLIHRQPITALIVVLLTNGLYTLAASRSLRSLTTDTKTQ